MIEITNKNNSDAFFDKLDILFVVFLSPIICKRESDLTICTLVKSRPVKLPVNTLGECLNCIIT